jgi:Flp pilus assembly protein TadG
MAMRNPTPARRKPSRRGGAAAVEFAIVAPVLFAVVLGIIEIGRGLMVIHLLNSAARAGCRAGVIEGKATSDINTAVTNVLSAQGMTAEGVTVQVNDGSADASTAQAGDEITVIVSIPASKVTWVPGASYLRGTLSGQFTLRRE